MSEKTTIPPVIPKPELALWIWLRGLSLVEAGELFGCSYEHVRKMCLPFSDARRQVPEPELFKRIHAATGGDILYEHFFAPEARPSYSTAIKGRRQ